MQKKLDVAQMLRGHACDFRRHLAPLFAIIFTTNQRSQKLRVEPRGYAAQTILGCRWVIVTEKLLRKAMSHQPRTNILFARGQLGGYGKGRVHSAQKRVKPL